MTDINPAQLAAIEAALAAPAHTREGVDDWAELRIERRGHEWRAMWCALGQPLEASPWRPRERWYSQLALFLGKLRNFSLKGLGKIPLAQNPARPREENP